MNIWIVEDDDTHAFTAATEVINACVATPGMVPLRSVRLYRNATVHWEYELFAIDIDTSKENKPVLTNRSVPLTVAMAPTIVILDLFDKALEFTANSFKEELRLWEPQDRLSSIIIWSVNSGRPEVQKFVKEVPILDRRVSWLQTKANVPLRHAVEGYLRQWMDRRLR